MGLSIVFVMVSNTLGVMVLHSVATGKWGGSSIVLDIAVCEFALRCCVIIVLDTTLILIVYQNFKMRVPHDLLSHGGMDRHQVPGM